MFFLKSKKKIDVIKEQKRLNSPETTELLANDPKTSSANISTISEGLEVTGSIISKGKVRFDGLVKGTIEAQSLYVGKTGFIDGKATAEEAVILGKVKGTLKGKKVRLASTSRIEGDTFHEVIAIEDGALYEGSIKRLKG